MFPLFENMQIVNEAEVMRLKSKRGSDHIWRRRELVAVFEVCPDPVLDDASLYPKCPRDLCVRHEYAVRSSKSPELVDDDFVLHILRSVPPQFHQVFLEYQLFLRNLLLHKLFKELSGIGDKLPPLWLQLQSLGMYTCQSRLSFLLGHFIFDSCK